MSLIKCSECGKDVSDKAASCPNCGNPINQPVTPQEEFLCCPQCYSRELHAEHKGFSGGKALVGAVAAGGVGLLAGTIGSRDTLITCLKCNHKFKAGEAKVFTAEEYGTVQFEENKIVELTKANGIMAAVEWYKNYKGCSLDEAKLFAGKTAMKHHISPQGEDMSGKGCMLPILIAFASTASLLLFL